MDLDLASLLQSDLAMYLFISAWLMPIVVSAVKRLSWSSSQQAMLVFAASVANAFGAVYFSELLELNIQTISTVTLFTLVVAISTYKHFWKELRVTQAVEKKTDY